MKALDKLIRDYKFYDDGRISCKTVLKHLETLKEQLKEQHKEDVLNIGQEIEVRDKESWKSTSKMFYVGTKKSGLIMAEDEDGFHSQWKQARPIQKPLQLTLEQVAEKFEVESVEIVKL